MYRQQTSQKASASIRTTPKNQDIAPSQSYGSLSSVVQRVQQDPNSVSEDERQQLESAIGSRSTKEILAGKQTPWVPEFQGISAQIWGDAGQVPIVQRKEVGVIQRMSQLEADNLDPADYPPKNITLLDYTQTADGNSLWIFRWNHRKNPGNDIEIHVHRGEMGDVSGINVRWLGEVGNGVSVNPAPLWIQGAAQNAVIAYMMNLSTGKGIFSNIKI
jgi:hypothetical protein